MSVIFVIHIPRNIGESKLLFLVMREIVHMRTARPKKNQFATVSRIIADQAGRFGITVVVITVDAFSNINPFVSGICDSNFRKIIIGIRIKGNRDSLPVFIHIVECWRGLISWLSVWIGMKGNFLQQLKRKTVSCRNKCKSNA